MSQEWDISLLDVSNPGVPCKNFGLRDDGAFWCGMSQLCLVNGHKMLGLLKIAREYGDNESDDWEQWEWQWGIDML